MALVLNGSSGITSDNIVSLVASKLTGQIPDANANSGGVLQVVQYVYSDVYTIGNIGASSGQFALPLAVTITPQITGSKIFISVDVRWSASNPNSGLGLYRDNGSTQLGNNPNNNYGEGWMGIDEASYTNNDWMINRDHYEYLDTHGKSAGTSITYDVRFSGGVGSGTTAMLNRSPNAAGPTSISTITAWEIAP